MTEGANSMKKYGESWYIQINNLYIVTLSPKENNQ